MARLNIVGFETGAAADEMVTLLTASATIQSTTKRTGSYALKSAPPGLGNHAGRVKGISATGVAAAFNSAVLYIRTYLQLSALPSVGNPEFMTINDTSDVAVASVDVGTTGTLRVRGTTNSSGSAITLSATTWYRIELLINVGTSGAYELRVDGATALSGTLNFGTTNFGSVDFGINGNFALSIYYDDIAIDDAVWPGPGSITRIDPDGAGFSAFSSQVGTFADVDDYSGAAGNDGDTTAVTSQVQGQTILSLACSACGLSRDSIRAVKSVSIAKTSTGVTPTIAGFGGNNSGANVTTSTPAITTLTGAPNVGDLIIIIIAKDGTGAFTWPGGWSSPTGWSDLTFAATNNQGVLSIRYRVWQAGDADPAITHASEGTAWQVYRFLVNTFTSPPEAASNSGDSTNPDPPNLDPSGWGIENTYWLAVAANDGNVAITAGPTNYTASFQNDRWANSNGVGIASGRRANAVSAENPGTFTMATEQWGAATVAVRPATVSPVRAGFRINSTYVRTTAADSSTSYETRQVLRESAAGGGGDWTVAQVDAIEVVAEKSSGGAQINVTALAIMVEAADSVPSLVVHQPVVRNHNLRR